MKITAKINDYSEPSKTSILVHNHCYKGACKCGKFSKRVTWNPTKDQAVEEWNYIIEREGKGDAE